MYESSGGEQLFAMIWMIVLVAYCYFTFAQFKVAQKLNHDNPWFAFIPILNTVQLVQMANKPLHWLIFLFIPIVNIVCFAILWIETAKAVGQPSWVGFCMLLPFINFVSAGMMAWGGGSIQSSYPPPSQPAQREPEQVG